MTTTAQSARQARVNGGVPGNVIHLPNRSRKQSWEILKEWADQRGWGSYRLAGAMMLAATPEERKRLPEQQTTLSGYWRRWLKGQAVPEAHMSDPNAEGLYRPLIARMMGTTPDKIWPPRTPGARAELERRYQRVSRNLHTARRELELLRQKIQRLPQMEDNVSELQAELAYLNAVLSVPAPDLPRAQ